MNIYLQLNNDKILNRYLTINSSVHPNNGLIVSNELTNQDVYLEQSLVPYRIIVINYNFFTMFCIFHFGKSNERMNFSLFD